MTLHTKTLLTIATFVTSVTTFSMSQNALAATIDFEGTGLSEGNLITNQISGITISGGALATERGKAAAFGTSFGPADLVNSGASFGGNFLAAQTLFDSNPINITFDSLVTDLRFVAGDIDSKESYTFEVFDIKNNSLQSLIFADGDANTGDAFGTLVQFSSTNIKRLEIRRTKAGDAIALGIDNITYSEDVPEPLTILGTGLALGFGTLLKKKKSLA